MRLPSSFVLYSIIVRIPFSSMVSEFCGTSGGHVSRVEDPSVEAHTAEIIDIVGPRGFWRCTRLKYEYIDRNHQKVDLHGGHDGG
jgi:hypothetical protein